MILTLILGLGHWSILDLIIAAILVWSIVNSYFKGFVREVLGLATLLLAILLSSWTYRSVGPMFKSFAKTESFALFCAFSVIFLGTLAAGAVAIWLMTRFMKFARIEWLDQVLGAGFGFIRGWILGAVLLLGLTAFNVQTDRVRNSHFAPYLLPGSRVVAVVTPYDLKARFLVGYRAAETWWSQQH